METTEFRLIQLRFVIQAIANLIKKYFFFYILNVCLRF